jgi:imidazoleglycerol-phosphate dehydratase
MLDQVARHGMLDLEIEAKGDLHIDAHHTVEDIGITLGQAFAKAIGDKAGIRRFGHAYVPLDEALSRVVIDFSGRPGLSYNVKFTRALVGEFDVDLVHEFFQGFTNHAQVTLHIDNLRGDNSHHQCETMFKAFARALRMAAEPDARADQSEAPHQRRQRRNGILSAPSAARRASLRPVKRAHVFACIRVLFRRRGRTEPPY